MERKAKEYHPVEEQLARCSRVLWRWSTTKALFSFEVGRTEAAGFIGNVSTLSRFVSLVFSINL